jgi:large subunit ribosomal protein L29
MKAVELRDLTLEELMLRESELSEELARMRIQLAIKRLDNPLLVRVTRRELARVKTMIKEKSLTQPAARKEPEAGEEN